jgi:hypothetical protein
MATKYRVRQFDQSNTLIYFKDYRFLWMARWMGWLVAGPGFYGMRYHTDITEVED